MKAQGVAANACRTPRRSPRPRKGTRMVERASIARAKSSWTLASVSESSQRRILPDSRASRRNLDSPFSRMPCGIGRLPAEARQTTSAPSAKAIRRLSACVRTCARRQRSCRTSCRTKRSFCGRFRLEAEPGAGRRWRVFSRSSENARSARKPSCLPIEARTRTPCSSGSADSAGSRQSVRVGGALMCGGQYRTFLYPIRGPGKAHCRS